MKILLTVSIMLALAVGCGGNSGSNMPPPGYGAPSTPRAQAPAPQAPVAANGTQVNPKFEILKPHFKDFLREPLSSKGDVFRPNLDRFAPTVEIDADPEQIDSSPKTPLEYFDTASYRLVLIMSGTAQSKALVIDPKDKSYIIQVGTLIGNRNGKVTSITSTSVTIDEPGYQPIVKTLESPLDDMERELQAVQEY